MIFVLHPTYFKFVQYSLLPTKTFNKKFIASSSMDLFKINIGNVALSLTLSTLNFIGLVIFCVDLPPAL